MLCETCRATSRALSSARDCTYPACSTRRAFKRVLQQYNVQSPPVFLSISQHRSLHVQPHSSNSFCCQAASSLTLKSETAGAITLDQDVVSIGSDTSSTVTVTGPNVAPQHAVIHRSKGRTTCTALLGDAEDLFSDTFTWLDGSQLRKDVAYFLQSGSVLSFGEVDNEFVVEYEEALANYAALEMVVKGMAAQASKEVREQLDL